MTVELGDYEVFGTAKGCQEYQGGLRLRGEVVFFPVVDADKADVPSIWHVSRFLGELCLVEEMAIAHTSAKPTKKKPKDQQSSSSRGDEEEEEDEEC